MNLEVDDKKILDGQLKALEKRLELAQAFYKSHPKKHKVKMLMTQGYNGYFGFDAVHKGLHFPEIIPPCYKYRNEKSIPRTLIFTKNQTGKWNITQDELEITGKNSITLLEPKKLINQKQTQYVDFAFNTLSQNIEHNESILPEESDESFMLSLRKFFKTLNDSSESSPLRPFKEKFEKHFHNSLSDFIKENLREDSIPKDS